MIDKLKSQHERFFETACAFECDENEAAFDEKLKAVVGPKSAAPTESNSEKL